MTAHEIHSTTRRQALRTIGVTAAASVAGAGTTAVSARSEAERATGGSWPMVQFDYANSGHNPDGTGPASRAGPVWQYDSGGAITATPLLSAETAYVTDSDRDKVRAIDRASGTERWSADFNVLDSQMALAHGLLYVPGEALRVYDAATGERQWMLELESRAYDVKQRGEFAFLTGHVGIKAVDITSGNVLWSRNDVETISAGAALQDSTLWAVSTGNGVLRALSVGDGGQRWVRFLGGRIEGSPTIAKKRVVVPGTSQLHAIEHLTGNTVWTVDASVRGSVAIANDIVYGVTTEGEAIAVSLTDGTEVWRTAVPTSTNDPVLVGNTLYVASDDGTVTVMSALTGSISWRTELGTAVSSGVAVAGGEVYVGDRDGVVHALSPAGATPTPEPTPTGAGSTETPAGGATAATATPTNATKTTADNGGNGGGGGNDADGQATETATTTPGLGIGSALVGIGAAARYLHQTHAADD